MNIQSKLAACGAIFLIVSPCALAAPDASSLFENSDFEKGTLENWTAEGLAFKKQPTKGDNPSKRNRPDASKHEGNFWIGTFEAYNGKTGTPGSIQSDRPTGRLTSIKFEIKHDYLNFLVGGGPHDETSIRLLVDGKTFLLSSGFSSETMQERSAEVKAFKGKKAQLILLDNVTGGWGHLNADNFTASDQPLAQVVKPRKVKKADLSQTQPGQAKKPPLSGPEQVAEMTINSKYLIYPISNGAPMPAITLSVGDKVVRFYTAELAPSATAIDFWAFEDVSEFKGRKLKLAVNGLSDEGFKLIKQSDSVPGEEKWGDEKLRPQFHFSTKVGWVNDPNGMVYYDGEWHLFIQHNPVGWRWGNMTWAHAVSKDLVTWEQLPNVFHHRRGDAMFSGGAAVDWQNTGGWKTGENDVIIATFTSTGRGECIAYSNDKGRTFTEYEGNPIIKHKGRDPKPIWYSYADGETPLSAEAEKLGGHWVLVVYNEDPKLGRNMAFHTSTDLKKWELQSQLPGFFECVELYTLPVDGKVEDTRWVVFGGDARYAIGDFDGKVFTPEHKGKHQLHWGKTYASQLFSDAPGGRRIQIGWTRGLDLPGMPFNQTVTFPTELTLRSTADGVRMFGEPVKEIEKIHGKKHEASNKTLADGQTAKLATSGDLFDIRATFEVGTAKRLGLIIDGREAFSYDAAAQKFNRSDLKPVDGKISVQILIDRPMIETFVNGGRMIVSDPYRNDLNIESVEAFARGGKAKLLSLEVHELNPTQK